jgi:hypothetical protein
MAVLNDIDHFHLVMDADRVPQVAARPRVKQPYAARASAVHPRHGQDMPRCATEIAGARQYRSSVMMAISVLQRLNPKPSVMQFACYLAAAGLRAIQHISAQRNGYSTYRLHRADEGVIDLGLVPFVSVCSTKQRRRVHQP